MQDTPDRPKAGDGLDLSLSLSILEELLELERRRLKSAVEIEERRDIVFPETTVIIRDIERLITEVERRKGIEPDIAAAVKSTKPSAPLDDAGGLKRWA
jgi:hypothetical protein